MHVLFGLDTWGLVGGTERYAAVVVPALLERGHTVTVLCREERRDAPMGVGGVEGVEVLEAPELGGERLSRSQRTALAERVRRAAPDVVYLQALRNTDALEALLAVAPLVRFVHDHTLFCPGLNKYREDGELCREPMGLACLDRYYRSGGCVCFKKPQHKNKVTEPLAVVAGRLREIEINRRAARILTNSNYMRAELLQVGFLADRVVAMPMFTRSNTEHQPPAELPAETARFCAEGGPPILFTPARLTLPDKGVDYLITALGAVRGPFRAVVAGTGPAEDWLRDKAASELGPERIHFTGWLPEGGVEALYARAHAVVCPSVWQEPFGLVGIEAMAHGKPIVAFAVGGIPDWLEDGVNGFSVARCDTSAMAAALDRLLSDAEGARELGRGGKRLLAERFRAERHLDLLEDALHAAALA